MLYGGVLGITTTCAASEDGRKTSNNPKELSRFVRVRNLESEREVLPIFIRLLWCTLNRDLLLDMPGLSSWHFSNLLFSVFGLQHDHFSHF